MKYKLGIIGTGVMANAIVDRVIEKKVIKAKNISVFDIDEKKMLLMKEKGMSVAGSLQEMLDESENILLSVKPQHYSNILSDNNFEKIKNLISIMAGVKVGSIREYIGNDCGVLRVMPNTPCKIGKGFCALYFDKVDNESKKLFKDMFYSCGDISIIDEKNFDAVTSVSGSGPAYVYMYINGMIKGGMKGGLSYENAKKMAVATLIGASSLAKNSDEDMEKLIEKVCSKGGTTIEAIKVFRKNGLEDTIIEGIDACRNRSEEISKNI